MTRPCSASLLLTSVNCAGWLLSLERNAVITTFDEGVVSSVTVEIVIWLQPAVAVKSRTTIEMILLMSQPHFDSGDTLPCGAARPARHSPPRLAFHHNRHWPSVLSFALASAVVCHC